MAPRKRAIPAEEWERHREVIKGLFAQKPLIEVIEEMKQKYNFEATKSQYEAKLRLWGIHKNLKREQWQELLKEPDNITATVLKTSSGYMKTQPSIQRALRRLKKTPGATLGQASRDSASSHPLIRMASSSAGPSVEQVSRAALSPGLPRQQTHDVTRLPDLHGASSSPESALLRLGEASAQFDPADSARLFSSELDDPMSFWWNLDFNPHTDCEPQTALFDVGGHEMLGLDLNSSLDRNWQIRANANVSPLGTSLMRRASPISPSQLFPDVDHFFGFNAEQTQGESRLSTSAQLPTQNGTLEGGIFDYVKFPPTGFTKQWLKGLPFSKFEEYLRSRDIISTNSESSTQRRLGASLSGNFALRFLENSFSSGSISMVQRPPDCQNPLQKLGKLLPGESTAIISEQQMTETRLFRILLFSMMNGFVGLDHIPMEDILKAMGHFSTNKLLLQILEEGPQFTARTLADNMFRAAIEAKDQRIVQLLLQRKLVDVNDTVCFFRNRRYTPVERAASLKALGLIRILVEADADVNKTHKDGVNGGALRKLLWPDAGPPYSRAFTATPGLIDTIEFLIGKGSKVDVRFLSDTLGLIPTNEIVSLFARSIPPTDHQAFFEPNTAWSNDPRYSLLCRIANVVDDSTAATILQNTIEFCEGSGCSKCLERWSESLEYAAIDGAKRGHFQLVQVLIGRLPSTTRILSAAVRSGNKNLIRLVLDFNPMPELDPPAHIIDERPLVYPPPTTPLAEAVRMGNADLIKLLEEAGALNNLAKGSRLEALILAAAEGGNMLYMELLLKRASSSSHQYRTTWDAVRLALENDHDDVANFLLSAGAQSISIRNRNSDDPSTLHAALGKRDHKLVRSLLSADIEYLSRSDIPNEVASWFDTSIISDLAFVFPDQSFLRDRIPFHNICMQCMKTNNVTFFENLLESTSYRDDLPWNSCLASAIRMGQVEMVDLLLQYGADPLDGEVLKAAIPDRTDMFLFLFGQDRKQRRVRKCIGAHILKFVMAERPGNAEILDTLLENGLVNLIVAEIPRGVPDGDLYRAYEDMLTPLGLAIVGLPDFCGTNLGAVNRLLREGSDPDGVARIMDIEPRVGQTAIMLALETGREDLIRLLVVEYKADVNKKTHLFIKQTPLQHAAELGDLDMVRLLLELGADVNGEPAIRSGGTALQFAAISGNCNVAAELLEQGAPLHALPSKVNGRWPLEGAAEHGRLDMVQFLWRAKEFSLDGTGFQERHCLRAMDFAQSNGHLGCRDLVAELSGFSVDRLDSEDYGVPWLAY
ncbi:ankyrin [Hyaloscypha bicolor E]|uniref:Ankyrin n=1 Tax=Hyaloscypha bicolor E TaxID=1095630 RepID=A0A2J6TJE2_9HELO|nr:ankyrin [Hyaloscypha bicolor E]PMD63137.1 ankyrin [Hyaloscypha bicolor E]